jgi:UDP-GlcNAc:undecaprenyl-phosphate GlcNAc-1-phosphate transferase
MGKIAFLKISLITAIFSFLLSILFHRRGFKIGKRERSSFGGLVIFLSILLGILISPFRMDFDVWRLFIPFAFVFLLGLWDDIKELSPFVKLSFETLIVVLTIALGLRTEIIYVPDYINYLITILWLLVIINAFNFLDIMDGLCTGVVLFVALTFSIIGIFKYQPVNLLFALLIFSSCLGFFPFNYRKAKAYLGDSGSLSLGFLLGSLAISFSYAGEDKPIALFTPLVILGLPIFDFLYVTFRRFIKGKSIFRKSEDHLALLMEKKGIPREKIVYRFWAISFGFAFSAIVLQFGSFLVGVLALILAITILFQIAYKYYK